MGDTLALDGPYIIRLANTLENIFQVSKEMPLGAELVGNPFFPELQVTFLFRRMSPCIKNHRIVLLLLADICLSKKLAGSLTAES